MSEPGERTPAWLTERTAWAVVAALMAAGLALRLPHLSDSLIGDETSTLWIVSGGGPGHVLDVVASDAEISPPLYFLLAWASTKLGSAPELVRLPALLAGMAAIPLTYLVGARAVGRVPGLIAAAAMTLSPFMVFYAANARVYALAIALLLASTYALLRAVRGGGTGWWVAYGALSCLAMYSHYTTAFVLAAQLLWALWAHPEARRAALLANVGAAIAFAPWIPSTLADLDSPTTEILEALQGDGFDVKRRAVEQWAFGSPGATLGQVPGTFFLRAGIAALVVAAAAGLWRNRERLLGRLPGGEPRLSRGMVLVLALAVATPVSEAGLLLLGGTDLFGARNLNTSSGGLALAIGAVLGSAPVAVSVLCTTVLLGAFAVGSVKAIDPTRSTIEFEGPARAIDAESASGDVVLDTVSSAVSPVPLTPLRAHLSAGREVVTLYLPTGPPPFLAPPPEPGPLVQETFDAAASSEEARIFLLVRSGAVTEEGERVRLHLFPPNPHVGPEQDLLLPPGTRVVETRSYEGIIGVDLVVVEPGDGAVRRVG